MDTRVGFLHGRATGCYDIVNIERSLCTSAQPEIIQLDASEPRALVIQPCDHVTFSKESGSLTNVYRHENDLIVEIDGKASR